MTPAIDLDHTAFAVDDALAWARRLRRDLGALPIAGDVLPEFRWLQLYVGSPDAGARIELLDPTGDGFLTRFLDRRGPGPHHITFNVPDLRESVAQARERGATVVGGDYSNPSWFEAFLMPDDKHGVVLQLAQTDVEHPPPAEPDWCRPLWEIDPAGVATLGATHLASTDLDHSRDLFGGLLQATVSDTAYGLELSWPSGSIRVSASARPGVTGMTLRGGPAEGIAIGPARLRGEGA